MIGINITEQQSKHMRGSRQTRRPESSLGAAGYGNYGLHRELPSWVPRVRCTLMRSRLNTRVCVLLMSGKMPRLIGITCLSQQYQAQSMNDDRPSIDLIMCCSIQVTQA